MKLISLLISLTCANAFSQKTIRGHVLDKHTSTPVQYASVAIIKANVATNADSSGHFVFNYPVRFPDTLLISSVGYFDERVPLLNYNDEPIIKLRPNRISLDSLTILAYRTNETINDFSSCGNTSYTTNGTVTQVAQLYSAPKPFCKINALEICKTSGYDRFRIRIYRVDSSGRLKPGDELIDEVIEVRSRRARVKIDLARYNIVLPGRDFFVAFEWLFIPENAHKIKDRSMDGRQIRSFEYGPYLGIRTSPQTNAYVVYRSYDGKWRTAGRMRLLTSVDLQVP